VSRRSWGWPSAELSQVWSSVPMPMLLVAPLPLMAPLPPLPALVLPPPVLVPLPPVSLPVVRGGVGEALLEQATTLASNTALPKQTRARRIETSRFTPTPL